MKNLLFVLLLIYSGIHGYAQKAIQLEDIFLTGNLRTGSVPGFNFMKDGETYLRLERSELNRYSLLTGEKTETLLSKDDLSKGKENFFVSGYVLSEDERKILLETDRESQYRHSYFARNYIFDRNTKSLTPLSEKKQQLATFSPDGSKVAYVQENDLYYFDIPSGKTVRITHDGKKNEIINGAPDWVYEEEFSFSRAFEWSTDGQKIAFLRFDESKVPEFYLEYFEASRLYPVPYTFKYPKVGERNSVVSLHVYDLNSGKTKNLNATSDPEQYLPRIQWTSDSDELAVIRLNRHQNHLELLLYKVNSNEKPALVIDEKSKYYVDIHDNLIFLKDGKRFIWTSEKDGYNHIYVYDKKGKIIRQLTSGEYEVTNIYGIDEKNEYIYFQAAKENALQREIYSIGLDGKSIKKISEKSGTHSAQFSSTFKYWVDNYSSINTPPEIKVRDNRGNELRILELNPSSHAKMEEHGVADVEFFDFKNREGITLNGWMIKPQNFNSKTRYPVLMYVYGGPGSQQVTDSWKNTNYWWFQMLAQKGFVVVCVDNRGTGGRGEEFKKMTYLELGKYEVEDQIDAARFLGGKNFIDKNRIGIFGWSYGGYMSTLCLLKGADVFNAAIAVAPVTNWKWYDSIYTERYMRTMAENKDGYEQNSPVNFAHLMKGKYLLIHGLADDNVHAQHAIEMSEALIRANKQFDMVLYPNRNHGIYGNNATLHLYTKMTNFLIGNL